MTQQLDGIGGPLWDGTASNMSDRSFLAYLIIPVIAYVGVWNSILRSGERRRDDGSPLAIETEPEQLQPDDYLTPL
jgi:hypothetical protein